MAWSSIEDYTLQLLRGASANTRHSDINSVIMDYLISEGYPAAAEKFAQETNLFQSDAFDLSSIRERVDIRNAILAGRIEDAIELLNETNTMVSSFIPSLLPHHKMIQVSCTTRNLPSGR